MMGLVFAELALRDVVSIDPTTIHFNPAGRADELAPAVGSLALRITRELDVTPRQEPLSEVALRWVKFLLVDDGNGPNRHSIEWFSEQEAKAVGGWDDWRREMVARPLVGLGLGIAEQDSPRSTPGSPRVRATTTAGARIVSRLGTRIANLDSSEPIRLARSQPGKVLDQVDGLGTAILLVPHLWPAVQTALDRVPDGETRLSPAGLRLAALQRVAVT